jgi:hypothetical protein
MAVWADQKEFNITGSCNPRAHYMVDTSAKITAIVRDYIERGKYFTINRARQYGKTTTLVLLDRLLRDEYIVIFLSFEGKEEYFASIEALAGGLRMDFIDALSPQNARLAAIWEEPVDTEYAARYLSRKITEFCGAAGKPVILMIDEVDRASDFGVFSAFLGLLREKYLDRSNKETPTFQSVILAGVHDIKNLKSKLRDDSEHSYNSPRYTPSRLKPGSARMTPTNDLLPQIGLGVQWNIAASFDIDMSFAPDEIAAMLQSYEDDHHTGMDIAAISERIYFYTGGYPFLVSKLCKTIDEKPLSWSPSGADAAETLLLKETNTLFDDMIKNIQRYPGFEKLLTGILFGGISVSYDPDNPDIALGVMFGILKQTSAGKVSVSNIIFETRISNYLISMSQTREITEKYADDSLFIKDGRLDAGSVIDRFAAFMKSEYRNEDGTFIERHARLLFLSFLRPIINGAGHYAVEPETRGRRRMDVVVFFGNEENIIELKIWRGKQAAAEAYDQLAGYLKSRGQRKGYLISFTDNIKSPREGRTFTHQGCEITEVIVAYRDKE